MNVFNKIFAGTYYYFIKIENGNRLEFTKYYAFSAILAVSLSCVCLLASLVMLFASPILLMNFYLNLVIGCSIFLVFWMYYVPKEKYIKIVKKYINRQSETRKNAIIINFGIVALFFILAFKFIIFI